MTMPDQVKVTQRPPFHFKRYVNGVEMAEDITIERESTLADAMRRAAELCPTRPGTVLVYCEADKEAAIQKARADALEEAAKAADNFAAEIAEYPCPAVVPSIVREVATAIRSLTEREVSREG